MTYAFCLHRWVGDQARYDRFAVPPGVSVHYLATAESVAALPHDASFEVVDLDDESAISRMVDRFRDSSGDPIRIIALNEADLLSAARLRERLDVPGDDVESVLPFRDKLRMFDIASRQSAVRVLPTADLDLDVEQLVERIGLPLVVKPRLGTASRGVRFVDRVEELRELVSNPSEPMLAQSLCTAPTRHIDGWWDGDRIVAGTASIYTSNCAEFDADTALGSFELASGPAEDRLLAAASAMLAVFSPGRELVFHLELFDDGQELTFLEIAARAGGAEIPFIWRELRNIDLVGIAWELQTGWFREFRDMAVSVSRNGHSMPAERGGWVVSRSPDRLEYPASVYWSKRVSCNRRASGVYEGANVRLRFRSLSGLELGTEVARVATALSNPQVERSRV